MLPGQMFLPNSIMTAPFINCAACYVTYQSHTCIHVRYGLAFMSNCIHVDLFASRSTQALGALCLWCKKGPRQGRIHGPPSSHTTEEMVGSELFELCMVGHHARICQSANKACAKYQCWSFSSLMLAKQGLPGQQANHFYFPIANDDDEVIDLRFEGAVHTAIPAEVPSDKHVSPPIALI